MFKQFTEYVDHALHPAWEALLPLVTQFEILYDELERQVTDDGYARSYAYWVIKEQYPNDLSMVSEKDFIDLVSKYDVKSKLTDKLDTTMYLIRNCLAKHEQLHQPLELLIEHLNYKLSKYVMNRVETN